MPVLQTGSCRTELKAIHCSALLLLVKVKILTSRVFSIRKEVKCCIPICNGIKCCYCYSCSMVKIMSKWNYFGNVQPSWSRRIKTQKTHWTSSICLGQIDNTSDIEFKVELLLVTGLCCFGGSSCTSIAFDNDMQLSWRAQTGTYSAFFP